jgi:hypothetical protein
MNTRFKALIPKAKSQRDPKSQNPNSDLGLAIWDLGSFWALAFELWDLKRPAVHARLFA